MFGQAEAVGVFGDMAVGINALPAVRGFYFDIVQAASAFGGADAVFEGLIEGVGNQRQLLPSMAEQYHIEAKIIASGIMTAAIFGGFDNIRLRRGLLLASVEAAAGGGGEDAAVGTACEQWAAAAFFLASHAGGAAQGMAEHAAQRGSGVFGQAQFACQQEGKAVAGNGQLGGQVEGVFGVGHSSHFIIF